VLQHFSPIFIVFIFILGVVYGKSLLILRCGPLSPAYETYSTKNIKHSGVEKHRYMCALDHGDVQRSFRAARILKHVGSMSH
jgi:hypothetical protein